MSVARKLELVLAPRTGYGYVPVLFDSGSRRVLEKLLLDTGAATTTLDLRLAADLSVDPEVLERERFQTAGGATESWLWSPLTIQLSGLKAEVATPRIRFVRNLSVRGLLGNDLLRAAGLRAVIDIPKGRAILANHNLR